MDKSNLTDQSRSSTIGASIMWKLRLDDELTPVMEFFLPSKPGELDWQIQVEKCREFEAVGVPDATLKPA